MLEGQTLQAIRDALARLYPEAKPERLIREAMDRFTEEGREPVEAVTGWCMAATRDLFRRLVEIGDYNGALKAAKQLHELAKGRAKSAHRPVEIDL